MQLISFDSPIKCSCKKRPSVHIKSPYVADIITSNEDDALAHCPSLGLGGLITGGSQMLATHSNKGSKTDYVIQAVKDGEVWVGNVPLHANRIVKKLLGTDLLLQGVKHVIPEFIMRLNNSVASLRSLASGFSFRMWIFRFETFFMIVMY